MATLITKIYDLENLDCASCAAKIETNLSTFSEVETANINFATASMSITCDDTFEVVEAVQAVEPAVLAIDRSVPRTTVKNETDINQKRLTQIFVAVVLWLVGLIFHEQVHAQLYATLIEIPLYGIPYLLVGWDVLFDAFKKIQRGQWMDEEILMSIATIGAIAIHELPEAIGVMLFYGIGEYLQEKAVASSRSSINSLLDIHSSVVHLVQNDGIIDIEPEKIRIDDEIIVNVGEQIPLDGKIIKGISSLDTSALTGESLPSDVSVGDFVLAGMINLQETLRINVSATYENSSIAKMVEIVQQATNRKAKVERFMTQFSRYYTPAVVLLSALVAIVPPIVSPDATFQEWFYRGLSLLVISCPCALVISIPLGYFGGLGALSKKGILVKGADNIDVLAKVETIVFDKTGTLTKGEFKISTIYPETGFDSIELLEKAAIAEYQSSHPIAGAIRNETKEIKIDLDKFVSTKEISGQGVQVEYANDSILAGNIALMNKHKIVLPTFSETITGNILYIAVNNQFSGRIVIEDEVKEEAKSAIRKLRDIGIKSMHMLTGDRQVVAEKISTQLGLDGFGAELFPEEKLIQLETMLDSKTAPIAYLGDGINDAPALARADVGISMGEAGSDIAIESSDVVLLTDDLARLPDAIELSRFTRKIVWQNIVFALIAKSIFILLGVFGIAGLWLAVIADVGVALLAVLNATRIIRK